MFFFPLIQASLEVEPRGCKQPIKAPRKWPDAKLKSPGIKPRSYLSRQIPHPLPSMFFFASNQRLSVISGADDSSIHGDQRGGGNSSIKIINFVN